MMEREKQYNLASFRMYMASCTGNRQNTLYSYPVQISSAEDLAAACLKDHVCTEFKDNRRSSDNFIRCHAIQADCDNDNTDDPAAWITPANVAERLPGVAFYAVKSRNCDKVKHPGEPGERSARPRWHYYFPLRVAIPRIDVIREIMTRLLVLFPEFDRDGMKPAQFFFGHAEPAAEYHDGKQDIAEFLREHLEITASAPADNKPAPAKTTTHTPAAAGSADDFFSMNVEDMLRYIPADDYKIWVDVGNALVNAGISFDVWDTWARSSKDKYPGEDAAAKKWRSFNEEGSDRTVTAGTIVKLATDNGWKPTPDKLTGEYKANHEAAEERKKERAAKHRENVTAALAAVGMTDTEYSESMTVTYNFDGSVFQIIDKETGEILFDGVKANPANPAAAAPANIEPATDPAAPWESIIKADALPPFPLERLPGWIADYIYNFAENTGISKDFCAACMLGAVSTVICGHLQVHFNGTHYEPAQLYTVFVGPSGAMKSTAVKQFIGPVRAWLMEKNQAAKEHNRNVTGEISIAEDELAAERKKKTGQDEKRIIDLQAKITSGKEKKKTLFPVPFTDVLPEAIIRSMTETNGAATIATAEGNIINVLTGRSNYNQRGASPNLDIFLAGYDGEPYHGIRVTSGEIELARVDISMLLAIQPTLLERLCQSSDANGRGLVQRFLIFAPDDNEKGIDHTKPCTMDAKHAHRWNEHVREIAERFMQPDHSPVTLELFADADMVIRKCWNYEDELLRQRGPADDEGITGWISKLHGKALRLAAILAALDEPQVQNITKDHAETAVALLKEYFIPHYVKAFDITENLTRDQKAIIKWIISHANRTGNQDHFIQHELQQDMRQRESFKGQKGLQNLRDTLEELRNKNIIRPIKIETQTGRGCPANGWQINPELFSK